MDFEGRAPMSGALDRRIAKIEAAQVPDRGPSPFPWLKPGMCHAEIDDAMDEHAVNEHDAAKILAWRADPVAAPEFEHLTARERLTKVAELLGPDGAKLIARHLLLPVNIRPETGNSHPQPRPPCFGSSAGDMVLAKLLFHLIVEARAELQ